MTPATRAEVCALACAEVWRDAGESLAAALGGPMTVIGARLARLTFSPDLLLTDGEAYVVADVTPVGLPGTVVEGWLPYRAQLSLTAHGRRHVMMGASQVDRYGNTNIAAIGDWARPKAQLLGVRGAPGNTVNNPTSYWVPRHTPRVFVPRVDTVSGVGYDRAADAGPAAFRFHAVPRVVTNLAVLDFATPDHAMRLASVHPGVTVEEVRAATGFELVVDGEVPVTPEPDAETLRLIRDVVDPKNVRDREIPTA